MVEALSKRPEGPKRSASEAREFQKENWSLVYFQTRNKVKEKVPDKELIEFPLEGQHLAGEQNLEDNAWEGKQH